jgi:type II secretory pathway component GspD/PulD (secretin)
MKKILLTVAFLFLIKLIFAQNPAERNISVNFQQAKIERVLSELEAQSGYHFYVDTARFDSLKLTLQVSDVPLKKVLDLAFINTN